MNCPSSSNRVARMSDQQTLLVFLIVLAAFLSGFKASKWAGRAPTKAWRLRTGWKPSAVFEVDPGRRSRDPVPDAAEQLRVVMTADFQRRRLMSPDEARVFKAAEAAVKSLDLTWRVMAQVSLGEVLASSDKRAYAAINSKRVDILLISSAGEPVAAIEYQGSGHYLGTAAARDAVKREALRRAGVAYVEVTPSHDLATHLVREIERVAGEKRVVLAA